MLLPDFYQVPTSTWHLISIPLPVAIIPFFLYVWHVAHADREETREEGVSGCQVTAWLPGMTLRSVALFSFAGTHTEPACWGSAQ